MEAHPFTLDLMREHEVPVFTDLVNAAFATAFQRLAGRAPPGRRVGDRVRNRFYRPDTDVIVVRSAHGEIRGVLPLQRCGTRGVPGPLAIAPEWQEPWRKGVASALVDALLRRSVAAHCDAIDSVTFAQSTTHFALYWRYGAPVFQALMLTRCLGGPVATDGSADVVEFSSLTEDERQTALSAMRRICMRFYDGFDLTADVVHVQRLRLGETYVLYANGRAAGFAVCHFGEGSEAYADDQVLIKYLYIDPELTDGAALCARLLAGVEARATRMGLRATALTVSSARRAAVEFLLERDYRMVAIESQWLMVPGAASADLCRQATDVFCRAQYALADWR